MKIQNSDTNAINTTTINPRKLILDAESAASCHRLSNSHTFTCICPSYNSTTRASIYAAAVDNNTPVINTLKHDSPYSREVASGHVEGVNMRSHVRCTRVMQDRNIEQQRL